MVSRVKASEDMASDLIASLDTTDAISNQDIEIDFFNEPLHFFF